MGADTLLPTTLEICSFPAGRSHTDHPKLGCPVPLCPVWAYGCAPYWKLLFHTPHPTFSVCLHTYGAPSRQGSQVGLGGGQEAVLLSCSLLPSADGPDDRVASPGQGLASVPLVG